VLVDPAESDGVLIDDVQAKLSGDWQSAANLKPFAGERYLYHGPKGAASARYEFQVKEDGRYEVHVLYQAHANRASNARVTVNSADGAHVQRINQRTSPPLAGGFLSLGDFPCQAGATNSVVIDNEGADGNVGADAVQIVPKR